jgi:hypothetical protein
MINLWSLVCKDAFYIKEIPKEFVNLRKLVISSSRNITYIPKEFVKLEYLDCESCIDIQEIPKEFINLRILNCSRTAITSIPNKLEYLRSLKCIGCENLSKIPNELKNLTMLECRYCPKITHIPYGLSNLKKLDCVECVNMHDIASIKGLKNIFCIGCTKLVFSPDFITCDRYNRYHTEKHARNVENNYRNYLQEGCKKLVNSILEELVQKTWEPKRVMEWCWDEEEKKFMNGMIS